MARQDIEEHKRSNKMEHELLLVNIVNNQQKEINGMKTKLEEIETKNIELENKVANQNRIIGVQTTKLEGIETKNNELENKVTTQNGIIRGQDLIIEALRKKVKYLNQFANDMSQLHHTLCNPNIRLNIPNVDKKEYETEWNDFVGDILKRQTNEVDPDFVHQLKETVKAYTKTVFPKGSRNRFLCWSFMIPPGVIYHNKLLKLHAPFKVRSISLRIHNWADFQKDLKAKQYVRNSDNVASFYEPKDTSFNVIVAWNAKVVTLLHPEEKKKHLNIPAVGRPVEIRKPDDDGDGFELFGYFIFNFDGEI